MRIVAGSLGGRLFDSPHSHRTHPMSDKMRGALFNILGDLSGLTVLDAFAGSGALSFEAISRGAAKAVVIDSDRTAQKIIAANIQKLGLGGRVALVSASANAWLTTSESTAFDIILCDPPYNDLQPTLLARLTARLKPTGVFVLSWPPRVPLPELPGLHEVEHRDYGDAQLLFYKSAV